MRLLVDQDVYRITIEFLKNEGHDVIPIKEVGLERASDRVLLEKAREMDRVFVTRDKDFGLLVFLEKELSRGVILLKGRPWEIEVIHRELKIIFKNHSEEELKNNFCVVEPGRHRIRRLR